MCPLFLIYFHQIMKNAEDVTQRFHQADHAMSNLSSNTLASTYAQLEQQMTAANLLLQGVQGNTSQFSGPPSRAQNHPTKASDEHKLQTRDAVRAVGRHLSYSQPSIPTTIMPQLTSMAPEPAPASLSAAFSPHRAKPAAVGHKRSREEVEQAARKQGATGG